MNHTRKLILVALLLATLLGVVILKSAQGRADTPPPPGWTASDWSALSPADQALELTDYDNGTGDPTAKAPWVGSNPDTNYDNELNSLAAQDGDNLTLTTESTKVMQVPSGLRILFKMSGRT
jgi:hypothetical protein